MKFGTCSELAGISNYRVWRYVNCNLGKFWGNLLQVCASMWYIYCDCDSFWNHEINPCVNSTIVLCRGGDIFRIYDKNNTQIVGWNFSTDAEDSWWMGQGFLVFMNGSWKSSGWPTYWPVGQPYHQVVQEPRSRPVGQHLNWRVGYNRFDTLRNLNQLLNWTLNLLKS